MACSGRFLSSARCRRTSASNADGAGGGGGAISSSSASNASGSLPSICFDVVGVCSAAAADERTSRGREGGQVAIEAERRAARWGAPGLNIPSSARFFAFALTAPLDFSFDFDIGIAAKKK